MKSIIAGLSLFALANAQNVYVATFGGDNDITGTVTIDNGYVIVDMAIGDSATVSSTENVTDCISGGLKYHIHKYWTHPNSTDRYVSGCGSTYTGGHWDPWHGCGSASGNDYCSNNGGCIPVSDYSADFTSDAFSAEVGDWNGKYGLAVVDNGTMFFNESSYFEVTPDDMDLMNFSIVFHCNSGSRAFCAPFIEDTSTSATESIPEQTNVTGYTSVGGYFDDIGSYIAFSANGSVEMVWDPTYLYEETDCTNFSYGIFEAGNSSWNYSTNGYMLTGDDCADYVGDFYDPTHQCMDFSGSEYCNDTGLCGDSSYEYSCDFANDRYSCAPGDLSGKMGSVSADSGAYRTLDSTALIPRVSKLDGMMAVFYCGNNSEGISYGACGPIREESEFTTTASPSNPTMEAVFYGDYGILGTVTVDNGYLMVDLDLSAEPNLPGGYSDCVTGGLKYHIHTKWDHDDYLDKMNGTDCGAGYTGGHYDPWHGCGSASGNEYCSNNGGCIDVTDYSADYPDSVFSAEVGDWNGKYGLAVVEDGTIYFNESSFWEVTPNDIVNMSIVFHCNGGSRAFCAPFVATGTEASETIPDQDGSTVMADFSSADGYTDDSAVYLYANGSVDISLDGSEITDSTGCEEWYYGIFEAGSTDMNGDAFVGDDCESYVGDFYDPTHQCMDFSGSDYCNGTVLCGAYTLYSSYEYTCDYDDDRYSCAPGDLSGKFGAMTDYTVDLYESGPDTLIPSTDDMVGYVFAIYCGNNSVGISYLSCAEITTVTTTTTEDGDSAAAHTVVVSVVAMVMAMLF